MITIVLLDIPKKTSTAITTLFEMTQPDTCGIDGIIHSIKSGVTCHIAFTSELHVKT